MKHLRTFGSVLSIVLVTCLAVTAGAQNRGNDKPKSLHAPAALPGVEPQMLTPEYWISLHPDADTVIMTPAQIKAWNARVRTKKVDLSEKNGNRNPLVSNFNFKRQVGLFMNPILPLEQPATVPGDSLKAWINVNVEWARDRDLYDGRNVLYNKEMIDDLVKSMNLEAIPRTITRRFGVIVARGDIRLFPTHIPGYTELQYEMDNFQNTSIYMTVPVTILHESLDGDYYFVESPIARGWISAETVAIGTPAEVRKVTATDNILLATANKVAIYGDYNCTAFRQYIYLSGYMPFVKKTDKAYVVKLPERKQDGTLGVIDAYLKPDADVHIGFLPYTKGNAVTQIFKLLGQPYGWADQLKNRDCSGTVRVMFRCFGLTMGRWPNFELLAPPDKNIHYIDRSLTEEEKLAEAGKLDPFITVAGSGGHSTIWLGKAANGKYYFIHQGGWGYDEGDQHYYVNRVAINEATHAMYNIRSATVFSTIKD